MPSDPPRLPFPFSLPRKKEMDEAHEALQSYMGLGRTLRDLANELKRLTGNMHRLNENLKQELTHSSQGGEEENGLY